MVLCFACGKPLDKVPHWLDKVKVNFICTNCPKRHVKNITQINLADFVNPSVAQESESGSEVPIGEVAAAEEELE